MKIKAVVLLTLSLIVSATYAQLVDLRTFLSPNVPLEVIPADLKLPDKVLGDLIKEFEQTIGKQGGYDTQFKIVFLIAKITNESTVKSDALEKIILWEVRNSQKTAQKIEAVSSDARVLAINTLAASSNSNYVSSMLAVIERDDSVKPRIAAAKALPLLGNKDLIVPKLLDLLKTKYGANRSTFSEQDTKRFYDDQVAQAVIETLGDVGDPRAFPVLLQTVMNPSSHRDSTIKAGWEAVKKLKW